jgi:hypothetical protein
MCDNDNTFVLNGNGTVVPLSVLNCSITKQLMCLRAQASSLALHKCSSAAALGESAAEGRQHVQTQLNHETLICIFKKQGNPHATCVRGYEASPSDLLGAEASHD